MEETRKEEKKTPIKMALSVGNYDNLILFERKDARGLFLGVKSEYETRGTYTGDLLKLCNNEDSIIFYILYDILKYADRPEYQKKLTKIYEYLQTEEDVEDVPSDRI